MTVLVSFKDAVCSIASDAVASVVDHVGRCLAIADQSQQAVVSPVAFQFTMWAMPGGVKDRQDAVCFWKAPHLWESLVGPQRGPTHHV